MPENFTDAQRIKNKRKGSFMGAAKEIKQIPKTRPVQASTIRTETPVVVETLAPKVVERTKPVETNLVSVTTTPLDNNPAPKQDDKLTITKGFIVGRSEDGKVLFKPFGSPDKLELVGFVEYAKAVSADLLNELAGTSVYETHSIKTGMTAALQGIKALLAKDSSNQLQTRAVN